MDKLITVSHAIDIVREVGGCDTEKCKKPYREPCYDDCLVMQIVRALSDANADAVLVAVEARLY